MLPSAPALCRCRTRCRPWPTAGPTWGWRAARCRWRACWRASLWASARRAPAAHGLPLQRVPLHPACKWACARAQVLELLCCIELPCPPGPPALISPADHQLQRPVDEAAAAPEREQQPGDVAVRRGARATCLAPLRSQPAPPGLAAHRRAAASCRRTPPVAPPAPAPAPALSPPVPLFRPLPAAPTSTVGWSSTSCGRRWPPRACAASASPTACRRC